MDKPKLYRIVSKGQGDTIAGTIIGTMAVFDSGSAVIEWDSSAWPDHKQLSGTHHSIYDSYGDANKALEADIRPYHGRD